MGEIVNLDEHRPKRGSWASGSAHCLGCNHHWVAVVPVGEVWIECPNCKSQKGRLTFPFDPPDDVEALSCPCGNDLFLLTKEGNICPNCGKWIET